MEPAHNHHPERRRIFLWVVLGCIALAVGYTFWSILQARASASLMQAQGTPLPVAGPSELARIQTQPHIVYLREVGPHYGEVTVAAMTVHLPKVCKPRLSVIAFIMQPAVEFVCFTIRLPQLKTLWPTSQSG